MAKITLAKAEKKVNNIFEGFNRTELSPQGRKLLKEWQKIDDLCEHSDVIKYIVRNRNREGLPTEYEIIYSLKSIIGVEEPKEEKIIIDGNTILKTIRRPMYGEEHRLSIHLPNNYPSAFGGNPEFKMITDTWHPNIRATGKFKGRICLNDRDLGVAIGLDKRVIRVGKYLQFQTYWANDSYPWPEDQAVAEWIREEAEPAGWVSNKEGICTDQSKLYKQDIVFQLEDQSDSVHNVESQPNGRQNKQSIIRKK